MLILGKFEFGKLGGGHRERWVNGKEVQDHLGNLRKRVFKFSFPTDLTCALSSKILSAENHQFWVPSISFIHRIYDLFIPSSLNKMVHCDAAYNNTSLLINSKKSGKVGRYQPTALFHYLV
jgi:hypothetical protein